MSKAMPGPHNGQDPHISEGRWVVNIEWKVDLEAEARHRVRDAAPELLEACKAAYAFIGKSWFTETPEPVRALRAAIAKAEGAGNGG